MDTALDLEKLAEWASDQQRRCMNAVIPGDRVCARFEARFEAMWREE